MATVKVTYVVQSCPRCGTKLLKVPAGGQIIGSPLITCKKCNNTYRTDLRVEWYQYKQKWLVFALPLILAAFLLVFCMLMADVETGVLGAILGFVVGLCISGRDIVRMIRSKLRMRKPEYLKQLAEYGVISEEEYTRHVQNAG